MRIKVLFFIDSFRIGGMHKQVLYLAKHLDRKKFDVIICAQSSAGGLLADYERSGARILTLHWTRRLEIAVFARFIRLLRKERPHIVFITAPQTLFYYRISRLFYNGNTIQIGSFRAMNFWQGHLGIFYKPIDYLLSIWMILTSKEISVNSNTMRETYIRYLSFISKKRIRVIYNGSDFNFPVKVSAATLRKELGIKDTEVVIVMIARLDPWKDFDTLLESAVIVTKSYDYVKFLLIGEGELRTCIEDRITQLSLNKNVFLLGEKKDIYDYINLSDISILSTNGEGFSNSILESMAFSKPVIATDVGGNAELLGRSGNEGFLVPPQSPQILAEIIGRLVVDQLLRKEIGTKARERIHRICDINLFTSTYAELFEQSILKKKYKRSIHEDWD